MKILFIIESLAQAGKQRRIISLLKELVLKDNIEIELIILSNDVDYKEVYDLGINIHFFGRSVKKDIRIFSKFNRVLKSFKPDIVHCWDNIGALHFGPICKLKKIPFINSMISSAPPLLSRFSRTYFLYAISYPFSDVILANSKAGLYSFRVPQKKGKCIYNGFDFNRGKSKKSSDVVRDDFNISTKYVVGMTGGFYDRKDYKTFVKAGKLVLNNRKDVTFVGIGDGPNLEGIKKSIEPNYLPNFRFLGMQTDVESIVNTFSIGVLATYTEGISNAIMEYMIFEKPVIATDGGGTNELVIDNENGFLIEQQNPDQLAEKIMFLLDNPDIASKMGKRSKERIENNFSIENMIKNFLNLYNDNIK